MVDRFVFPGASWKINQFGNWVRIADYEAIEKKAGEASAQLDACRSLNASLRVDNEALRARLETVEEGMEIASAMSRMNLARAKEAEAKLARAGEVHGPYGYLIKPHGLNEEHWQLSMDPSDSTEETSVALYALEEQELAAAARSHPQPGATP